MKCVKCEEKQAQIDALTKQLETALKEKGNAVSDFMNNILKNHKPRKTLAEMLIPIEPMPPGAKEIYYLDKSPNVVDIVTDEDKDK